MISNKCKKIISISLLIVMIATMFPMNVFAGGYPSKPDCIKCGKCGKGVRYSLDLSTGELSIYGKGAVCHLEYDVYEGKYYPQVWTEYRDEITSLIINDGVTSIGDNAFMGCRNLKEVTIPDSVTKIGYSAFACCESLTSVTIPKSVTEISGWAFRNCENLTSIIVDEENPYYQSIDGVLFLKDRTILYKYPEGKTATSYIIPDSVTSIGNFAFYYCANLKEVTISGSVTSIGKCAFNCCANLKEVTISGSVTSIGKCAFNCCKNLTSVNYLGKTNPYYKCNVFSGCSQLVEEKREKKELSKGQSIENDLYMDWEYSNGKRIAKGSKPKPNPYRYIPNDIIYTAIGRIHVPSDYQGAEFCGIPVTKGDVTSLQPAGSNSNSSDYIPEEKKDSTF